MNQSVMKPSEKQYVEFLDIFRFFLQTLYFVVPCVFLASAIYPVYMKFFAKNRYTISFLLENKDEGKYQAMTTEEISNEFNSTFNQQRYYSLFFDKLFEKQPSIKDFFGKNDEAIPAVLDQYKEGSIAFVATKYDNSSVQFQITFPFYNALQDNSAVIDAINQTIVFYRKNLAKLHEELNKNDDAYFQFEELRNNAMKNTQEISKKITSVIVQISKIRQELSLLVKEKLDIEFESMRFEKLLKELPLDKDKQGLSNDLSVFSLAQSKFFYSFTAKCVDLLGEALARGKLSSEEAEKITDKITELQVSYESSLQEFTSRKEVYLFYSQKHKELLLKKAGVVSNRKILPLLGEGLQVSTVYEKKERVLPTRIDSFFKFLLIGAALGVLLAMLKALLKLRLTGSDSQLPEVPYTHSA